MTISSEPNLEFGSDHMRDLFDKMIKKQLWERLTIRGVLDSAWFKHDSSSGPEVDMSALEALGKKNKNTQLRRALLADVASRENFAQLTDLNKLFVEMDKDNDGVLTPAEVREALSAHGWSEERIQTLLSCLGEDGRDIPYEEFMVTLMGSMAGEEKALVDRIFREVDSEGNGMLNIGDIEKLLEKEVVASILRDHDAAKVLKAMDANGDGYVSMQEFSDVMLGLSVTAEEMLLPERVASTKMILPSMGKRPLTRPQYKVGDDIEYYSSRFQNWIPGVVEKVDTAKNAVMIDKKPGWWLKGAELRKIRPRKESAVTSTDTSVVKASLGRQVLSGAMSGSEVMNF